MIVVYILNRLRFNTINILLKEKKSRGKFKKRGCDYNFNPNAVYFKKAFGIKLFRYCQYIEGNPNPIIFTDDSYKQEDIQELDDVAYLMYKLKNIFYEKIIIGLIACNILLTIIINLK